MDVDQVLFVLGFFAFCGGLIDAAVGGGGVQLPSLIHALPQYSLATVFGTNKLAVLAGTVSSFFEYIKRIKIVWRVMHAHHAGCICICIFGCNVCGLYSKEPDALCRIFPVDCDGNLYYCQKKI